MNDYAAQLLIDERYAQFRHETAQDRLARLAAEDGRVRQRRRWWVRLMLTRGTRRPAADHARPATAVGHAPH